MEISHKGYIKYRMFDQLQSLLWVICIDFQQKIVNF